MTILEAGIIAGAPVGAAIGGVVARSLSPLTITGSITGGFVAGAIAGWLFALLLICLLSITGVLWRAVRRHPIDPPSELDIEMMTPIARAGTFFSAAAAGAVWLLASSWPSGLVILMMSALVTALLAVARCEFRRAR